MQIQLSQKDEQRLVDHARQDLAGFQELYDFYFPRIYAFVAYQIDHVHDVEDVVSNIFLNVIQGLSRFEYRGEGSFAAWIFRIARNQVLEFYRQNQHTRKSLPLDTLHTVGDGMPDLADTLVRQESFSEVRRLITTLPPRRREIITLKFFAGLRNKDIAAILGIDERSVAAHLCRGLQELHHKHLDSRQQIYDEDVP